MPFADYPNNGLFGFEWNESMLTDYQQHGYFIIRGFLDTEELGKVQKTLDESEITSHAYGIPDDDGGQSKLVIWSYPGNDITGMLSRCEKVVNTCEKILDGEVYFYHGKLMMKDAFTGGRHVWHQDYGYWYKNGCLTPDLLTVYFALDSCNKQNGCLQVLRGSHKCGRVDHNFVAGQTGIDKERLKHLMHKYERVHVEMEPGDVLFFHCNLVHMADQNKSPQRRWTLLYAYNRHDNNPVYKHHHPQYTRLHKVPNSAIKTCENYTDMNGKEFLNPCQDNTVKIETDTTDDRRNENMEEQLDQN